MAPEITKHGPVVPPGVSPMELPKPLIAPAFVISMILDLFMSLVLWGPGLLGRGVGECLSTYTYLKIHSSKRKSDGCKPC